MTHMLSSLANGKIILTLEVSHSDINHVQISLIVPLGWIQFEIGCRLCWRMHIRADGRCTKTIGQAR